MSEVKQALVNSEAQLTSPEQAWEIEKQTIDGVEYKCYKNAPKTLAELFAPAREHGDKTFLVYQDEEISFTEFFEKADAIANQLISEGIGKGQQVAIAMRNYPEWMMAYTGIALSGAVVVPLNSWWQGEELAYALQDSKAIKVFCDQQRYDSIADKIDDLGVSAVIARPESETSLSFGKYAAHQLGSAAPEIDVDTEDTAMIMYTSGTTGKPKGAESSHRSICQAIFNFEFAASSAAMADLDTIMKMLEKGFEPTSLLAVPLFHVSGCHSVFLLSVRAGRRVIMMYKWDVEQALKYIQDYRATMVSAVPAQAKEMLESPLFEQYDTSSLFGLGGGGSAQPAGMSDLIYKKLPDGFPGTGYGMTETNAVCCSMSGAAYKYKPASTGTPAPIVEIRICDENGEELNQGEHGEIWIKTPTAIKGYWNKPEANQESFVNGWYRTGDVGYLDEEEFLYITDRIKDMVIRGGENIYSAEIETCISKLEEVAEVAAFGIPHDTLGEELAVTIRVKTGFSLEEQAVKSHCSANLAGFKVPGHVFFRSEEFPINATRKILKKPLKEEALAELAS